MLNKEEPEKLGKILSQLIKEKGWETKILESKIPEIWDKVVGEKIKNISKVLKVVNNKIVIQVESSTWKVELNLRKKEIIKKLNDEIGFEFIKEIIIK